ncbi:hypothetical protein [Endothiovibrio diazotrophicus]
MNEHYQNPYGTPMQGGVSHGQDQAVYPYGQSQGGYYYAAAPISGASGYGGYGVGTAGQAGSSTPSGASSLLGFTNDRFLKGLLIGAAATYLLTNEGVQRATIHGAVKAWSMVQGGVEEMKERFRDAEAEIRAAESEK